MVPLYTELVDVYESAFVIKKLTNGIQGDYQPPTNVELIDLVRAREEDGLEIPFGYAPAVFSKTMLENDFRKNLLSYEWAPDEKAWEVAKACFKIILSSSLRGGIMSLEDALQRMDKTTSPGYPWNLKYKTKGEAWIGDSVLIREIVRQVFLTGGFSVDFEYRPGKFMKFNHIYYQVSPKGELRTVDKLLNADESKRKTRTFMCGDIVLYLITVMVYGNQHDAFLEMSARSDWSAVGMNPWYGGWNRMAAYLSSGVCHTPRFWCFDVSHMEASVNDNIQTVIDATRNENIVHEKPHTLSMVMQFLHLSDIALYVIGVYGWLYLILGKNPSGKFLTADDNTLALILAFLYAIARKNPVVSKVLDVYYSSPAKIFGDDSIIQERDWVFDLITSARDLGFELKLECQPGPLIDARFLNAGFHHNGSTWVLKPNFEKIRASIFFLWKSRSWRLCYVKVCAYRQLVFPFAQYRDEADRLLQYILSKHGDDMVNEKVMDPVITYGSTRAALMSNEQNEFLCTGHEGGFVGRLEINGAGLLSWKLRDGMDWRFPAAAAEFLNL